MIDVASILAKPEGFHANRAKGIGGSDAAKVMAGDWLPLWSEKTGRAHPDDLSRNLAVIMGTWTEALNRFWYTQETGWGVAEQLRAIASATHPFMLANLDGINYHARAVFEAKHVNAFTKDDEVVTRYFWQLQHYLAVTGFPTAHLSVFFGNAKWAYFEVARDDAAIADLIAREAEFWGYVERDEPPPAVDAAPPVIIAFDAMREVDMTGRNEWAAHAADWLANRDAAKAFEGATKAIKDLIEADVKKASGHGIVASKTKAGSITIKAEK